MMISCKCFQEIEHVRKETYKPASLGESLHPEQLSVVIVACASSDGTSLRGCERNTTCGLFPSCSHVWSRGANGPVWVSL